MAETTKVTVELTVDDGDLHHETGLTEYQYLELEKFASEHAMHIDAVYQNGFGEK